jgi:capsular exopolysaccharide synthesis family protein
MAEKDSKNFILLKSQENGSLTYPQSSSAQTGDDDDEFDIRELSGIIKRRWRLIAGVTAGVTAIAALWSFTRTPVYAGKFQLLIGDPIEEQQSGLVGGQDNMLLQGLDLGATIDYATQIEILLSPKMLDPLAEKISRQYSEVNYNYLVQQKDAPLNIEQLEKTKILEVSYKDVDREKIEYILNSLSDAYMRYSLEDRQSKVAQGIKFVKQQLPRLRQQVEKRERQLQQFQERYNLLDPEKQAEYIAEQQIEVEQLYFDAKTQLDETNSLFTTLQKQIGLDPEQALATSYLSESLTYQKLLEQLQEVEGELAKESSRYKENSPVVQTLQENRDRLLPLLQKEAQNVLGKNLAKIEGNPPASASTAALRSTLTQSYIEAANQREVLRIRRDSLLEHLTNLRRYVAQLPTIARQYTELQRELEVETAGLQALLEEQQRLLVNEAKNVIPWEMIASPTVTQRSVYPRHILNLAIGAMAGLLLGIGTAFLIDRRKPVFHSYEELKKETEIPLLGIVPLKNKLSDREKLSVLNLPKPQNQNHNLNGTAVATQFHSHSQEQISDFIEAFRALGTNLRFLGLNNEPHSFVISSAQPEDGKSTVAINLAQAAAVMDRRVLLIDADLRRPQIHEQLGITNEKGLSHVLEGGLAIEEVAQQVPQWNNLSVVTAGELPAEPLRLLASKRMRQIMEELKQRGRYDLIIYDTPPIKYFSDSRIVAGLTHGAILVARINHTDRTAFRDSIESLKLAKVPILGIVANGVERNSAKASRIYDRYKKQT